MIKTLFLSIVKCVQGNIGFTIPSKFFFNLFFLIVGLLQNGYSWFSKIMNMAIGFFYKKKIKFSIYV